MLKCTDRLSNSISLSEYRINSSSGIARANDLNFHKRVKSIHKHNRINQHIEPNDRQSNVRFVSFLQLFSVIHFMNVVAF